MLKSKPWLFYYGSAFSVAPAENFLKRHFSGEKLRCNIVAVLRHSDQLWPQHVCGMTQYDATFQGQNYLLLELGPKYVKELLQDQAEGGRDLACLTVVCPALAGS